MGTQTNKATAKSTSPHGLGVLISYLSKVTDPLTRYGGIISGAVLAIIMFLTFINVAGRMIFHKPLAGYIELTALGMVVMIGFGIGYCAAKKGHVRVDIVSNYVSKRASTALEIFAYGIACIFYIILTWQCWLGAMSDIHSGLSSGELFIPVYPFKFLLVIGTALLALVFLMDFLKAVDEVRE